jgi:hypothetical protein
MPADAGPWGDVAAEENEVGAGLGGEEVRHRQAVGHHLQRAADQEAGHFVGGGAAVEEHGLAVGDQVGGPGGDRPLGCPVRRLAVVELGEPGHPSGVENAAVGAAGRPLFLEGVEIAADRRFGDAQLPHEFLERGKAADADQFQKSGAAVVVLHGFERPVRTSIHKMRSISIKKR